MFALACSQNSEEVAAAKVETTTSKAEQSRAEYAMVIHGGAGVIRKENMTDEKEKGYIDALNRALDKGQEILKNGGSAADAVEQTIMIMENYEGFNAGKGAVFTHDGTNETVSYTHLTLPTKA